MVADRSFLILLSGFHNGLMAQILSRKRAPLFGTVCIPCATNLLSNDCIIYVAATSECYMKGKLGSTVLFHARKPPLMSPMNRSPPLSNPRSLSFWAAI